MAVGDDRQQQPSGASTTTAPSSNGNTAASSPPSAAPAELDNVEALNKFKNSFVLPELYTENVAAKLCRVADSFYEEHPKQEVYPEYVLAKGASAGKYIPKAATFWTCGFFPASLYCVLERAQRFPHSLPSSVAKSEAFHEEILRLARRWAAPIRAQVTRTNSHDLGFITRPLRNDWELTHNHDSLREYCTAASSLSTRWNDHVQAIRSWDAAVSYAYDIQDKTKNFLVIIDSMCNMDLLFYAANQTQNPRLAAIATEHSHAVRRSLLRDEPDGSLSSFHVVNFDPTAPHKQTIKSRFTHQGYADNSTWSRGQAWGILGFAQTYGWTGDEIFLETSRRLADYFIKRLDEAAARTGNRTVTSPYVPKWDFDAPDSPEAEAADPGHVLDSNGQPLRDTSAGMAAANGMLLLHQALEAKRSKDPSSSSGGGPSPYLAAALRIASDTISYSLDREDVAHFVVDETTGNITVPAGKWDAILKHSTPNMNRNGLLRYGDVGLVYADYYFLEFGNQLLRMGLV